MKKFILATISAFAVTAFIACSADTIANIDSTDAGPTGVVSNKKIDKVSTPTKKASSSSTAKSSSSSAKSSSSSDEDSEKE